MATIHNEANMGDIAKNVIICGDPLRAKYYTEKFLDNYRLVNKVRNMYMYTGYYKGKEVTIASHGMGMGGAGIYFYELFKFYDVEKIIRLGTCGTSIPGVNLLDLIIVNGSFTESNYAFEFDKDDKEFETSDKELTDALKKTAEEKGLKYINGNVMTVDIFDSYTDYVAMWDRIPKEYNVLASEMESFALFHIAKSLGKKAACLVTVSDSKLVDYEIDRYQREKELDNMALIALDTI